MESSVDPDQIVSSEAAADLDPHCFLSPLFLGNP